MDDDSLGDKLLYASLCNDSLGDKLLAYARGGNSKIPKKLFCPKLIFFSCNLYIWV
jgi:hypothetical protein